MIIMNTLRQVVLLGAMTAGLLEGPVLAAERGAEMPSFELTDQFGRQRSDEEFSGRSVILVGGDRGGQEWAGKWAEAIESLLSRGQIREIDMELLRIADLSGTPRFSMIEKRITRDLRERQSSILLDWHGVLARAFEFEPGVANVILVGPDGEALFQAHFTEIQMSGLERLLEIIVDHVEASHLDCLLFQQHHFSGAAGL